jgi:uncharacterized protein (DUF305 family)
MPLRSQLVHSSVLAFALVMLPGPALDAQQPDMPTAAAYTEADVRFMQDMMVHHAQAVEMTALVAARTERADVRRLAARIAVSQEDEMELMRRWLEARGEAVPDPQAHHAHAHAHAQHAPAGRHGHRHGHGHQDAGHAGMPGMVSADDMARLRAATGPDFDRLFLEFMIHHHEGALVMVAELMATDGAGQESEIFQFASHVDGDQRIEIARMRRMLEQGG